MKRGGDRGGAEGDRETKESRVRKGARASEEERRREGG